MVSARQGCKRLTCAVEPDQAQRPHRGRGRILCLRPDVVGDCGRPTRIAADEVDLRSHDGKERVGPRGVQLLHDAERALGLAQVQQDVGEQRSDVG